MVLVRILQDDSCLKQCGFNSRLTIICSTSTIQSLKYIAFAVIRGDDTLFIKYLLMKGTVLDASFNFSGLKIHLQKR